MNAKEELKKLLEAVIEVRSGIRNLQKYRGNAHYRKRLEAATLRLNRSHRFLAEGLKKLKQPGLSEKFNGLNKLFEIMISESKVEPRLDAAKKIEMYWPEIEVEIESAELQLKSFDIPAEIPMTESRLDLEEAIKDFDSGCFISALVLCRRSYEGALVALYRRKTKSEPIDRVCCKHCKAELRAKAYFGIGKLHAWAIENKHVTDKLKQVGFLVSDIGAGGAHPPLAEFSRDPEMARLGLTATIALLKEIARATEKKTTIG